MGTEINASAVLSTASCVYNLKTSLHMQNVQAVVPEGFVPEATISHTVITHTIISCNSMSSVN